VPPSVWVGFEGGRQSPSLPKKFWTCERLKMASG
jgi:hypothetical protein